MIRETFLMIRDIFSNLRILILNRIHKTAFSYKKIVHNSYRKFVILILVSTIPTGVIGILGKELVELSSETLLIPGLCLLITGVLLLMTDHVREGRKLPKEVSYPAGLVIGTAQGSPRFRGFPVPEPPSRSACSAGWSGSLRLSIRFFCRSRLFWERRFWKSRT